MGDLLLPLSSSSGLLSHEVPSSPTEAAAKESATSVENLALLDVLREAVATGAQSTDSILHAIADAAGVLSGAHGTALAMRRDGAIICRARSGDIAPELGSPLNTESGISGECLRTATILVCNDAETDLRVDPEVCRMLGVRAIVAVPLRGLLGMVGILEVFSSQPNAFGKEQIDWLRGLAEIAELAYEREKRSLRATATSKPRGESVSASSATDREPRSVGVAEEFPRKAYWIIGGIATAVLLITLVVRLSWRQTGADIAASEPATRPAVTHSDANSVQPVSRVVAKSDSPVVVRTATASSRNASKVQKAAEISPVNDAPKSSRSVVDVVPENTARNEAPATTDVASEGPPSIDTAPSITSDDLPRTNGGEAPLPAFGGSVSQGTTQAILIRMVDPLYPQKARAERVDGPVALDATIGADGSIRAVTVVSGPPMLVDAAASAVRQWRYRPATLNGKPIEAQKRITLMFKLP